MNIGLLSVMRKSGGNIMNNNSLYRQIWQIHVAGGIAKSFIYVTLWLYAFVGLSNLELMNDDYV